MHENFLISPKISSSSTARSVFSPSHDHFSFSESMTCRTLDMAELVIMKWNPDTTTFARVTSLFYENRREATDFVKTVNDLQMVMQFLLKDNSSSDNLTRAQNLMQIAMKRLHKEFYQILSMNRAHVDLASVSTRSSRTSTGSSISKYDDYDNFRVANETISEIDDASSLAMADLRLIVECMMSSGYAKECLNIYKIIRKSIVDEAIYRLGVEKFTSSQMHKMDWQVLDLRIQNWLSIVRTAVTNLFNREKILCDYVFASSDAYRESCFAEITKEGAMVLFGFPENVAKNSKKSTEKVFRVLDMYAGISEQWPEIDSIFSFHSTLNIKSQALTSLIELGEFVRAALNDFESVVSKDSSKYPIPGGGIHCLTIDGMNYLSLIADYGNILSDIFADSPPPAKISLPDSYFGLSDPDEAPALTISLKMAWLILVILCRLDTKAKYYKDFSLAYLFLANNLQLIVTKVRTSNLKHILGDEWLTKHESKVKQFASNYQRLGWSHAIDAVPSDHATEETPEKIKEIFSKFNATFNQAYKKQSICVVPDGKLRDEIKLCIARKIVPLYREFYNAHRRTMERERNLASMVRYTPEDVGHRLSDLFSGSAAFLNSRPSRTPLGKRTCFW